MVNNIDMLYYALFLLKKTFLIKILDKIKNEYSSKRSNGIVKKSSRLIIKAKYEF